MAGYAVGIRNGLITGEHRRKMGMRIWEFLWLVDHVTDEYALPDGEIRGKVLGGIVIEADRIAADLDVHRDTVLENLKDLELAGYIWRRRAPRGFRIEVRHSKKRARPPSEGESAPERIGESESRRVGESADSPTHRPTNSPIALDNAVRQDNAESQSSILEGEAAESWTRAVAAVVNQTSPGIAVALAACSPTMMGSKVIEVLLPADPALEQKARMALPMVSKELRAATGMKIELVPHEARAGP